MSFTVDDCHRRDRDSRHGGVVSEPEAMGHGNIVAVFEDGCGDLRNPDQHVPAGVGGWATV